MIGTGKTLTCEEVSSQTGLTHIDVGTVAKQHDLYDGWDEQYNCPVLDEDKVDDTTPVHLVKTPHLSQIPCKIQ